jgi:hypothetical protein
MSVFAVPTVDDANAGWVLSTGTSVFALLDDIERQPTAPTTASDLITCNANGGGSTSVSVKFADPGGHASGISSAKVWVYLSNTNPGSGLDLHLNANVSAAPAGTGDGGLFPDQAILSVIGAATSPEWVSFDLESSPAPSDFPLIVQLSGSAEGGAIKVYSTYIELVPTVVSSGNPLNANRSNPALSSTLVGTLSGAIVTTL